MKYKPTTVYLDPEDHARLKAEAAARGISLAELLREITAAHLHETAPRYGAKGWDALIGVATSEEPVDDAANHDDAFAEALEGMYADKREPAGRPVRRSTR